jgi:hypothetical protein
MSRQTPVNSSIVEVGMQKTLPEYLQECNEPFLEWIQFLNLEFLFV